MIHTIAIPTLSMAIAWPLGNLASFWQYMWGLAQGEFKGVAKKTGRVFLRRGMLYSGADRSDGGPVLVKDNRARPF
jgi:hypothetical protein